jgi:hypothetical protein
LYLTVFVVGLFEAQPMAGILNAFDLSHECERVGEAGVEVRQTGARDVLAGLVGEFVAEGSIKLAGNVSRIFGLVIQA